MQVKNKDLYGRTVAACAAGGGRGGDLGAYMVENGWAVAYRWGALWMRVLPIAGGQVVQVGGSQAGRLCRWGARGV